jgi:hypothetical protein
MYDIVNLTPFQTAGAPLLDVTGEYVWSVVVKGTFRVAGGTVDLADRQEPVARKPDYRGVPGASSLRCDSELCPVHPGTDVTVDGVAHPPDGRAAATVDVSVRVGDLHREVRVHGNRVWTRRFGRLAASDAQPFVSMPVTYERAFGGRAPARDEAEVAYPANPVGIGYYLSTPDDGSPLPNVEDPQHPIRRWKDRPAPAGMGPIDHGWPPRLAFAGTYDDEWKKHQAPLWPADVNARFFSCAPPGLYSETPLRGGEPVVVENMTPEGTWTFTLPRFVIYVRTILRGRPQDNRAQLDRVLLLPGDRRVVLTWRAVARCGDSPRVVNRSSVWAYKITR